MLRKRFSRRLKVAFLHVVGKENRAALNIHNLNGSLKLRIAAAQYSAKSHLRHFRSSAVFLLRGCAFDKPLSLALVYDNYYRNFFFPECGSQSRPEIHLLSFVLRI